MGKCRVCRSAFEGEGSLCAACAGEALEGTREAAGEVAAAPRKNALFLILGGISVFFFVEIWALVTHRPAAGLGDVFVLALVGALLLLSFVFEVVLRLKEDGDLCEWNEFRWVPRYQLNPRTPFFTTVESIVSAALAALLFFGHWVIFGYPVFRILAS